MNGLPHMQSLVAKHGKQVVTSGPLKGSTYESVSEEKLKRAARRYTQDPAFQKYARGYVLLQDLDIVAEADQPPPCAPIAFEAAEAHAKPGVQIFVLTWFRGWVKKVWQSRWARALIVCSVLAWLLRPSVSAFVAKAVVTAMRLGIRRLVVFVSMILEGLLDEMVYQLEYTVREALPTSLELPEKAVAHFSWLTHLFSGGLGAGLVLLTSLRRAQGQA